MSSRLSPSRDAMEASTTQSAAESEEDLLLLQQSHQQRHSSAFSTSSVDQFLRDNGFQIDGDDDDVLSSSATSEFGSRAELAPVSAASDDDAAAAVEGLLRPDVIRDDTGGGEGDGERDVLSSDEGSHLDVTTAGEEGDLPAPRFILLDDEDLMSMSHEPPTSPVSSAASNHEWRPPFASPPRRPEQLGSSFDRSMLLGGSGLSALSEESRRSTSTPTPAQAGTTHRNLPTPRKIHERAPIKSGLRPSLLDRLVASSSSSSSASYASSAPGHPSSRGSDEPGSSSRRSHDNELSDALGVRSSQNEQEQPPAASASKLLEPRRLSSHDDEEQKHNGDQAEQTTTNPWTPPDIQDSSSRTNDTEVQRALWSDLNVLLRKNGLPTLALRDVTRGTVVPDHASMINLVQEFLLQLGQKNEAIQGLVIESNRTHKAQSKAEGDVVSLQRKRDELTNALQNAQNEIQRLQGDLQRQKEDSEKQFKTLKASCLKLQQQLKVSEHRVKAKEVLVERMQKKVQQQVDKENLNKTRDRTVFRKLQQRDPRKANARDSQSLEYINMYETQREQMHEEIEHLRSQVAVLNAELRDKENTLSRHSSFSQQSGRWSGSFTGPENNLRGSNYDPSDDMLIRLEAARREQEQAAAKLRLRETAMVKKIAAIEEELLAARETIAELKDENANLTLEAESRPSIRDYRLSQRRIHQLERQLSENKLALEEANDINELRRFMGTTELIERDRLNHRLHLNRLTTLPKETLLEVVKEVCRVLNLTDITLITPSIHKMCNVVIAVPRMEKFIRDVCGFVYFNLDGQGNQNESGQFELEKVLPTLQQWVIERKKMFELEGFKTAIVAELCKRTIEPSLLNKTSTSSNQSPTQLSSLPRAVHIVAELVELEKSVLHHKEIYALAAEELERRPSVLVNQIVRHFSHLFHVKQVDGVLPKINEIYLFVNEMENFLKTVRSLLLLSEPVNTYRNLVYVHPNCASLFTGPDSSPIACIEAIRRLVEGEDSVPKQTDTEPQDVPNYVVEKSTRGRMTSVSGGVEGVRQVREMSILIRELKKELGAATMHEILPRTRRLMELLSLSIHQTQEED